MVFSTVSNQAHKHHKSKKEVTMFNDKAKLFRKFIAEKELVLGVGARDALEAKIIEQAGFDFVWSSSLCVSASYAVPDASLISMKQYLEAARLMNEVIGIPVIVDGDTGYGNANNVIYAVKLFEEAGIAGISMEDKKFPKDNSLLAGGRQELASIEEFAGKIMAAKDTQKSGDFYVIARVEALIAGWGQEEALRRSHRYVEAGADCIMIHSKSKTPDEIIEFIHAWDGSAPLMLVPTTYPSLTEADIKALGKVKISVYANQLVRASIKIQETLLEEIKKAGGVHTCEEMMAPVTHIFELQGVPDMKANEKKYLVVEVMEK
jgi:phosphoenolpyruvate phosphomutase